MITVLWKQLFFQLNNFRYVDTLVDVLKQKLSLVEKMNHLQEIVREKQQEVKKQAIDLQPVLKLVIEKTKELQAEVGVLAIY